MPRKQNSAEQIIMKLREMEVMTSQGQSVTLACRNVGISEQTYYRWRKEYGGLNDSPGPNTLMCRSSDLI